MRLYSNGTLVKSVFSSLESNHFHLIREFCGEKLLSKKMLVICTVLSRAARLERGLWDHPNFTVDILEAILILLKCDLVDRGSAGLLVTELIKV